MKLLITTQAVDQDDPVLGFFVRWLAEFAKHCEQITVVCLRAGEYELPAHVRVYALGEGTRLTRSVRLWRLSLVHRRDYEAVLVHMNPEYIVAAGLLWRLLGKRIALWYTHKSVNLRLRIALILSHRVLTASPESFRIASPKVRVIGHGIETDRPLPRVVPRSGVVRLMTAGRVSRAKGLDTLVEAYRLLKEKGLPVSFVAFGAPVTTEDLQYEKELRAKLESWGEVSAAILPGPVPHRYMPEKRAEADYFIHASETGSLDKAVLDAIVSGLIPISSSEAYQKLFEGYETHLTFPRADAAALASRILSLEALPDATRAAMAAELRKRVEKEHSLKALVPAILKELV